LEAGHGRHRSNPFTRPQIGVGLPVTLSAAPRKGEPWPSE
jgi:hypothetical protein